MEGADPGRVQNLRAKLRSPLGQLTRYALAQLLRCAVVERDRENPVGRHALLDQPAEALGGCEGLAGPGTGGDEERAVRPSVSRRLLLWAQSHSGGAPP